MALDEQSFQSLLAAAYTIQQHNDQLLRSRLESIPDVALPFPPASAVESPLANARSEAANAGTLSQLVCEKCGTPKLFPDLPCAQCSEPLPSAAMHSESLPSSEPTSSALISPETEPLRPGERLQRNWASMWMRSQEQNQWLSVPADSSSVETDGNSTLQANPGNAADRRPSDALSKSIKSNGNNNGRRPFDPAIPQSASNALANPRIAESTLSNSGHAAKVVQPAEDSVDAIAESDLKHVAEEEPEVHAADPAVEWNSESLENLSESTPEDLAREESNFALHAEALDLSSNPSATKPAPKSVSPDIPPSLWQQLAGFRVILSFHRADLYLTLAVVIALVAILWPVAAYPRPGSLSTWQRTLITLGIAEAATPAPVPHFQGDPSIQVWVDPHTGIYYCPGEDQYGKTNGGRYATQRDAQQDSFEAASRSACD
jgi:hypothetical protein